MSSQEELGLLESARNVCLALPEAVEHIDGFGHTTFQINGKSFVRLGESEKGSSLSFKSNRETQEWLLQKEYFFKTPYIGHHGWVSIRNPRKENWVELTELIQEAYLLAAPKRLVREWMELHKK
ncbi:MAG TPA: MmcQ/YjbR family DNA-binding protein [Bacillus sp. (in: firmicutes)]|uniref:MmcQ/YjbR family DNA-binding protein n=1 Tax=Bacillus litorisediminis TaxID=2922713 RepID=UPI001FACB45E|nr:MmcQ/YjbR family DNA-binding protein [Bacillus litorisediminis]HWO77406.1 MmcQ/YjbR family DNA-binding protein [Bacillus sp. (in: firmicutes)]